MWDRTNIKIKYKKSKRYAYTFGELPLTALLPSKDPETRREIVRIAMTNAILKIPVNKLFPFEKSYQDNNQAGMVRQQKLRWEVAVIGELKKKYEC